MSQKKAGASPRPTILSDYNEYPTYAFAELVFSPEQYCDERPEKIENPRK